MFLIFPLPALRFFSFRHDLMMCPWLALNSQRSACICLLSARIKGVHHNTWPQSSQRQQLLVASRMIKG